VVVVAAADVDVAVVTVVVAAAAATIAGSHDSLLDPVTLVSVGPG